MPFIFQPSDGAQRACWVGDERLSSEGWRLQHYQWKVSCDQPVLCAFKTWFLKTLLVTSWSLFLLVFTYLVLKYPTDDFLGLFRWNCHKRWCFLEYKAILTKAIVTSIKFHPTISLQSQMCGWREWIEWSALIKCLDIWANSLKQFNKKHKENSEENMHVDIGANFLLIIEYIFFVFQCCWWC